MDERAHLHDGERLLHAAHPARSVLVGWTVQGIVTSLIAAAAGALAIVAVFNLFGLSVSWWIVAPILAALLLYLSVGGAKARWNKTLLRITTERILLVYPKSPFSYHQKTIKWNQFQESSTGSAGFLQMFGKAKQLKIRYGSSDAPLLAVFPAIPHAQDVKHYLDKVDSAVRRNALDDVKAFVAKPKGRRDE
jgi:hypothetical protein